MGFTKAGMAAAFLAAGVGLAAEQTARPAVRSFEITASRFQFDPGTIEVLEGDQVKITVKSADTTHGFAVKDYKVKVKIPKGGEPVTLEFVADKPGTFEFTCSEYCGPGHRDMKGKLVVGSRAK